VSEVGIVPRKGTKLFAPKFAAHQIWTLCTKNLQLYFRKGPVVIFGLLFPFFMALTWVIGRGISATQVFVGITVMAVFFTSTAMSPVILPIETREKGLERQMVAPVTLTHILGGILLASTVFSILVSLIVALVLGIASSIIISPWLLLAFLASLGLMACVGSLLGVLLSAPPTDQVPDIMTLATLIKFSLLFISGVFIPLSQLPLVAQFIAWFSPLTPFVDLTAACVGDAPVFSLGIDFLILIGWAIALYVLSRLAHSRTFEKRFALVSGPAQKMGH